MSETHTFVSEHIGLIPGIEWPKSLKSLVKHMRIENALDEARYS
jgi:hypothetical protein